MTLKALLVDGKTVVEQVLTDVIVKEKIDDVGSVTFYIDAPISETIPDVKPEGSADSGFDVDVDDWKEDEEIDIPI